MLKMENRTRDDAIYRDFGARAAKCKNRSVEPRNGGPTRLKFVKVVGQLAKDGQLHGIVLKRLCRKETA